MLHKIILCRYPGCTVTHPGDQKWLNRKETKQWLLFYSAIFGLQDVLLMHMMQHILDTIKQMVEQVLELFCTMNAIFSNMSYILMYMV